jgi:hypothetical protein
MYVLLELGGRNLEEYYNEKKILIQGENVFERRAQLFTNILIGAAEALAQFHNCNYIEN